MSSGKLNRRFLVVSALILLSSLVGSAAAQESAPALNPKDKLIVETVLRLKDFDLESSAPAKAAVLRYLRANSGTDQYFELIARFKLAEIADDLVGFSLNHSGETSGVRGAELLFAMKREDALRTILDGEDEPKALAAVTLIGHAAGKKTLPMLMPLLTSDLPVSVRSAAVVALGGRADGQKELLALVTKGKLPDELKFAAANALLSSSDQAVAKEAAKHLQLPATADSRPLPPLTELVRRKGNAEAGAVVFRKTGTCINCHKIRGEGKEVGPELSEIGSKLSREAMYVAILDPSVAVSHNFETYSLLTDDGTAITGLLVSETDQSVTLRNKEGIDKTIDQDAIEIFKKQKQSLMPQDLQKLMTADQLIDLVEYTLTLRKEGTAAASP